jgi:hypothetical protein
MWEPQRLTILWASTACYRDCFTFCLNNKEFNWIIIIVIIIAIKYRTEDPNEITQDCLHILGRGREVDGEFLTRED